MAKAPALNLILDAVHLDWNDLLFGQVLSKSESVRPIMTAHAMLSGMYGTGTIPQQMAAPSRLAADGLFCFWHCGVIHDGLVLTTAGE